MLPSFRCSKEHWQSTLHHHYLSNLLINKFWIKFKIDLKLNLNIQFHNFRWGLKIILYHSDWAISKFGAFEVRIWDSQHRCQWVVFLFCSVLDEKIQIRLQKSKIVPCKSKICRELFCIRNCDKTFAPSPSNLFSGFDEWKLNLGEKQSWKISPLRIKVWMMFACKSELSNWLRLEWVMRLSIVA